MELVIPSVVRRPEVIDYYQIEEEYYLFGTGFKAVDIDFGSETTASRYVNQASESEFVTGYKPVLTFDADLIANDDIMKDLLKISVSQKLGGDAIRPFVRVHAFQGTSIEGKSTEFPAFQMLVTVKVESMPDNNGMLGLSGSLLFFSDYQEGTFDISTKKFKALTETRTQQEFLAKATKKIDKNLLD